MFLLFLMVAKNKTPYEFPPLLQLYCSIYAREIQYEWRKKQLAQKQRNLAIL